MARSYILALAEEERLRTQARLERRLLREVSQPMDLPDRFFRANFRLTKAQFVSLCNEICPNLKPWHRSTAVQPELKVLAAITFYGNGPYQKGVGAYHHLALSQTKVHDCLWEVTEALNNPRILAKYINFPATLEDRAAVSRKFMDDFGIPGVIGCIDGAHVAIVRPQHNEEAYFSRKLIHSLNVLIICDADLRIRHIDASFGGASHDSHVWNQCPVQQHLAELHEQGNVCWLLGDSGYAQRPYLMVPILNAPPDTPEAHYTYKHVRARNVVERCIGVLKNRWRCLLAHRVLHYAPVKAGKIVNACAVLHNLIADDSFPLDEELLGRDAAFQVQIIEQNNPADNGRQALVNRLWRTHRRQ